MPEGSDFQRRMPAIERRIADIKPEDIRVRVTGTVVGLEDGRIALDDGTGKVEVALEGPVEAEANRLVRVLGRVISSEDGLELQGEVVQDMSGLDLELLKKVQEAENK
ncbi:MAG: replication protein RepA [Candidatus Aenigmatarchaeota archaeon]